MDYRNELGLGNSLKQYLGIEEYDQHQKKLVKNVKYCANDKWQFVNSYYDGYKEDSWDFFEDAQQVYDMVYDESGKDIFGPGYSHFGKDAERYLENTRFAGKKFKQIVVLYFVAKLYEEAVDEIEFSIEQKQKVLDTLKEIKASI